MNHQPMPDSPEKLLALWQHINETIATLAKSKSSMPISRYNELMDRAYSQKRIVSALMRSLRPVADRDRRVSARYNYEA